MRKITLSVMMTLDGYFGGSQGETSWFVWEPAMDSHIFPFVNEGSNIDTILMGKGTYDVMSKYWPTADGEATAVRDGMNNLPKVVLSNTEEEMTWNSQLVLVSDGEEITQKVRNLKSQEGGDILLMASGSIVSILLNANPDLIDEYRIFVNPLVLGDGKPLFKGITNSRNLKLIASKAFDNGVMMLSYTAK